MVDLFEIENNIAISIAIFIEKLNSLKLILRNPIEKYDI